MVLRMARPIKHRTSGIYIFKERVPADLRQRAKGTRVALPIGDTTTHVTVGGEFVELSLRTRDPAETAFRHAQADAALRRHWDTLRNGPVRLNHKQAVALAGDVYRFGAQMLDDPDLSRDNAYRDEEVEALGHAIRAAGPDDCSGVILNFLVNMIDQHGINAIGVIQSLMPDLEFPAEARFQLLQGWYGMVTDMVLTERGLSIDEASRQMVMIEVRKADVKLGERARRMATASDYGHDVNLARFPEFESPVVASAQVTQPTPAHGGEAVSPAALFDRWKDEMGEDVKESTARRYRPALFSLSEFTGHADVRNLTQDRIWEWIDHRLESGKVSKRTVKNNDLIALRSVLEFATTREGGKLLKANPATGMKLRVKKAPKTRERRFRDDEIKAILRAANAVKVGGRYPKSSAGRRWSPWLAAYSGARIQEVIGLEVQNVRTDGGAWMMDFLKTKTDEARTVPIHDHLIEMGFLDYVKGVGKGALFIDPASVSGRKATSTRAPSEVRASEIAVWVREQAKLGHGVDPNHGWRHTWKSIALSVGIEERYRDAVTGHAPRTVGRKYEAPTPAELAVVMGKYPRYVV